MTRTLTIITALLGSAYALSQAPLTLTLTQDLVIRVQKDGKTVEQRTTMPKAVKPGDVLVEEVAARNTTKGPLRNAAINLPVPKGTAYAGEVTSSAAARPTFTIDGKTYAEAPLKKTITVTENGKTTRKDVTVNPNEYTGVRWVITTINPDETKKLSFRVNVK